MSHNYSTLSSEELRDTWEMLTSDEAFTAFDAAGVDNATIAVVLGQEAAQEYCHWIYKTLK